jgi:deazaflavin-dependent oxidoreductase (nitroreductase family)
MMARLPTRKRPLRLRLVERVASARPGAWFLARALPPLDRLFLRLSAGQATLTSLVTGLPVAMVTTIGARSGRPRTAPLLTIRDPGDPSTLALVASNWGQRRYPAWYYNLRANPLATCASGGKVRTYLAHEAAGEEYEQFWRYAVSTYLGYVAYQKRAAVRRIPIMVLVPWTASGLSPEP